MKVLLIGDSIRLNAESWVDKFLPNQWEIVSPSENCESSMKVRRFMRDWLLPDVNIIHINCGLHDVRINPGEKTQVSELSQYIENLNAIFQILSTQDAKIIWATSTPILEHQHNAMKKSRRYLFDLKQYNAASVELALQYGFEINDMYSKIFHFNLERYLEEDGLHFNEQGNEHVGKLMAEAILGIQSNGFGYNGRGLFSAV